MTKLENCQCKAPSHFGQCTEKADTDHDNVYCNWCLSRRCR